MHIRQKNKKFGNLKRNWNRGGKNFQNRKKKYLNELSLDIMNSQKYFFIQSDNQNRNQNDLEHEGTVFFHITRMWALSKNIYRPRYGKFLPMTRQLHYERSINFYRREITLRLLHANIYLNLLVPIDPWFENKFLYNQNLIISAGMLEDYNKRKKRKRTRTCGIDLAYSFIEWSNTLSVKTLIRSFVYSGNGNLRSPRKGFLNQSTLIDSIDVTSNLPWFIQEFSDNTRLSHNGTKPIHKRRL